MRAELAGKLSMSSPSPQDRTEDTLTDAVFSGLAYLPRRVLGNFLDGFYASNASGFPHCSESDLAAATFHFWPQLPGGVEPDVLIEIGNWVLVFEAKYGSPFSTGEAPGDHQLVAEWRRGREWAQARGLRGPLVIAVTNDLAIPDDIALVRTVLSDDLHIAELDERDAVAWCPWYRIADAIESCRKGFATHEDSIAVDVLAVMERRSVRFMFEGFQLEDYWTVAAASRVARDRLFPQVAMFAKQLIAELSDRHIEWAGRDAGVVWWESKRLDATDEWGRSYVLLPFVPTGWPKKTNDYLAVVFDFATPRMLVGCYCMTFGNKKQHWIDQADGLATALNAFDSRFSVVTDGYLNEIQHGVPCVGVDEAWLRYQLDKPQSQLRVARSLDIADVDSPAIVAAAVVELSTIIAGSVIEALILGPTDHEATIAEQQETP